MKITKNSKESQRFTYNDNKNPYYDLLSGLHHTVTLNESGKYLHGAQVHKLKFFTFIY
jgi:hypothetical protein